MSGLVARVTAVFLGNCLLVFLGLHRGVRGAGGAKRKAKQSAPNVAGAVKGVAGVRPATAAIHEP